MKKILLVGSGYMAQEYLKVIKGLGEDCTLVARDNQKATEIAEKFGYRGFGGGTSTLESLNLKDFDLIINASSLESLKETTLVCFKKGAQKILLEKPGAMSLSQLEELSSKQTAQVRIAHNRRYYNSIRKLRRLIAEDGGPVGCFFDFTDREKDLLNVERPIEVKRRWGYANSSHVIDAAFFLIGYPKKINCITSGYWECHPSGTVFTGSGESVCPFSYFATWNGGGRWNIEVSTEKGRYKLSPLEELQFCKKNQFSWENLSLDDEDDKSFKPGLKKMVKEMLEDVPSDLPDLKQQIEFFKILKQVFNYED
ncbi:MAG: Gfo/Idh/MocA family protein [Bacteriovoracaceae bacterium]